MVVSKGLSLKVLIKAAAGIFTDGDVRGIQKAKKEINDRLARNEW